MRVIAPDVGGGFGVKSGPYREEVLLAWLARRLGRPVKWIATRGEDQITTNHSRGSVVRGASWRVDADGRITGAPRAHHLAARHRADERARRGRRGITRGSCPAATSCRPATSRVTGALTTTTPVAAYRGAGRPEATYVIERLMDEAARGLGLDPAEIRRRNFIAAGALPVPHGHRPGLRLRRLPPGPRPRARGRRLRRAAPRAGGAPRARRDRRHRARVLRRAVRARLGERQRQGRALGARHRHHRLERPRAGARDHVRPDRGRSPGRHARRRRRCCTATRARARRASAPSAAAASPSAAARSRACRWRCATRAGASRPSCSRPRPPTSIGVARRLPRGGRARSGA